MSSFVMHESSTGRVNQSESLFCSTWSRIQARGRAPTDAELKELLDQALLDFHSVAWLDTDPLGLVHPFFSKIHQERSAHSIELKVGEKEHTKASEVLSRSTSSREVLDLEVVSALSAQFAYGNVKQIRQSIGAVLEGFRQLEVGPSLAIQMPTRDLACVFRHWKQRFQVADDLLLLFELLKRSFDQYGSLGAHFAAHQKSSETVEAALVGFLRDWRKWSEASMLPRSSGFLHYLASPENGSACKRWCMFLRWMIRRDSVDFGIWQAHGFTASQLIMPLDIHTARVSRRLGILKRKSTDWKAALEVIEVLRRFDPKDPTRYDFALCRVGMVGLTESLSPLRIRRKC
jgi:uncharacterized protein (TIGR02757 family)